MKTRTGFVSNSSSSSFVIVATDEIIKSAKNNLTKFGIAVVEHTCNFKNVNIFGTEAKVAHGTIYSDEFAEHIVSQELENSEKTGDDEYYDMCNAAISQWEKFKTEISKAKGYVGETDN